MAFQPGDKLVQFADLKSTLSQSKAIDPALYQTVQTLIERLDKFKSSHDSTVDTINNNVNKIVQNIVITPNIVATYLTLLNEVGQLPQSVQLLAGTNITFDDSVANRRIVNATSGGADLDYLGNYAPATYNDGDIVIGSDGVAYMCVKDGTTTPPEAWPGSSGGTGSGGGPHAPTHEIGGTDIIDIKLLGGYPSDVTKFLNGTGTFSVPPGGGGGTTPSAHHTTHEIGGTDVIQNVAWTNVANVFTQNQLINLGSIPTLSLSDSSGTPGNRTWDITVRIGNLFIGPASDDGSSVTAGLKLFRNGDVLAGANLNVTAVMTAISGLGTTPLNASQLTSGTVPDARLSVNVLKFPGGYPGGTTNFLRADGTFSSPPGSGGVSAHHTTHETGGTDVITSISGAIITSGTIADARLSTNVALKNIDNNFSSGQTVQGNIVVRDFGLIGAKLIIGTTISASFPAWRNTGAAMECVLADNTNWANLTSSNIYTVNTGNSLGDLTVRGSTDFQSGINVTAGAVSTSNYITAGKEIYPGRVDVAGPANQFSWYLSGHGSFGLYTNTGLYVTGNIWTPAQLLVNMTPVAPYGRAQIGFDPNINWGILLHNTLDRTDGGYFVAFTNASNGLMGVIQSSGGGVIYSNISDKRLKIDLGKSTNLASLRALTIHDFELKSNGIRDRGVFAQEAYDLYPLAVAKGTDEMDKNGNLLRPWGIDYSRIVPDLITGWQHHEAEIAELKAELKKLRGY